MNGLLETIRSLKRGRHDLRVCPRCGSTRIHSVGMFSGWILPDRYVCDNCGYMGFLFLELEKEK
jgi:transposase-like protein